MELNFQEKYIVIESLRLSISFISQMITIQDRQDQDEASAKVLKEYQGYLEELFNKFNESLKL